MKSKDVRINWRPVAEIDVDPASAVVYEHGWQSWTPTSAYAVTQPPHRPRRSRNLVMHRGGSPIDAFHGSGLLAVQPESGAEVHVFAAADPRSEIPTIRCERSRSRLLVSADGDVEVRRDPVGDIEVALARWADELVERLEIPAPRPAPTTWCSWYHYFTRVAQRDIDENLNAMMELDLPVEIVQLDDGYQAAIGDWLTLSDRFASLPEMVKRIQRDGRRAGIWIAPFLVGARSELARHHPDWLVQSEDGGPIDAGHNWEQDLYALDVTHSAAAAYLTGVLATFRGWGFDFFKIDFIYAGALAGRRRHEVGEIEAYRLGLRLVREAIGDAYLLGCGAPILASIGLVDAMRVSPDTGPIYEAADDLSEPAVRSAIVTGAARAFQHGRFWISDPDCLIARPEVERREEWARHVARHGGLRSSSDRLRSLDAWGIDTTRRYLGTKPAARFVDP
jgi:alpha-galactosidase